MRTSFHHHSEAQPPNGPLTAATSPDTPSPFPCSLYVLHELRRALEPLGTPACARAAPLKIGNGFRGAVVRQDGIEKPSTWLAFRERRLPGRISGQEHGDGPC